MPPPPDGIVWFREYKNGLGHITKMIDMTIYCKPKGPDALAVVRPTWVYLLDFFCFGIQVYLLLSPYLCFISYLYLHLYVLGDDALIS